MRSNYLHHAFFNTDFLKTKLIGHTMNTLLAISITLNLAIAVLVTYFLKKYGSLRFLFKKDTNLEYESIFTSVFEYAPYSIVIQRIDNGACVAAKEW